MIVLDTKVISEIFRPSPEPRVVEWLVSPTGDVEITSRGAGRRAVVLSPEFFNRAMQALLDGPCQPGNLQLNGGDGEMRIRVADYRVIYDVIVDELLVLALRIGHRREVHR